MSDPRNDAHDKKVAHEKKHTTAVMLEDAPVLPAGSAEANASPEVKPPSVALEGSLVVLGKLKELEFHSRAHLERLAELTMTVEDELKQKAIVGPLGDVYSAQSAFQTKLTALIDVYKAECDRMEADNT